MQFIPVRTRTMNPPQDDLFEVLDEFLPVIQEGDVVLISSKVVAIHEGRCVSAAAFDKEKHVEEEAELVIPRSYWPSPLTFTNHMLVGSAGVDQSNSNGYYTLLPKEPFVSAEYIHTYLRQRFGLNEAGVVITDSHSVLARYGAVGGAIAWWGFSPLLDHRGKKDLFGRAIQYERSNLVDGLAAGATVVMGEVAESTPVVIAREVPNLKFVSGNTKNELFVSFREDTLRVLYERFLS
ncbi:coenzyme F420-0:L-glutamate ligase [Candidatus Nomurabacteria bacterium]|nr:coenzyme F420-0:L-glutamate ligase [Candidatus Nomurabacteria bacterium]